MPLSPLGYGPCRCHVRALRRPWLDLTTDLRNCKRLHHGRLELPTAPSRNFTLRHRRSGPTRPPRVVKRQRSLGSVSPRTFATSFRMIETAAPVSSKQFTTTWFPFGP
ncbi:conserved hypothetical protein [Trichinella spiralis]|uniref:hypothetical protein n=1 Tax=Trichinella spiralis TaxID=6334 RepID=UPI0001EFE587|nr:conserved hypothetical protein [Trichinella spiralis]